MENSPKIYPHVIPDVYDFLSSDKHKVLIKEYMPLLNTVVTSMLKLQKAHTVHILNQNYRRGKNNSHFELETKNCASH